MTTSRISRPAPRPRRRSSGAEGLSVGHAHQARGRGDPGRRRAEHQSRHHPAGGPAGRGGARARRRRSRLPPAPVLPGSASTMRAKPTRRSARQDPAGWATRRATTSPRSPRSRCSRPCARPRAATASPGTTPTTSPTSSPGADLAGSGARALGRARLGGDPRLSRLPRPHPRYPDRAEIRARTAAQVREEAGSDRGELHRMPVARRHDALPSPPSTARLKERGLNPGTSADLTVATLFAASLIALERPI